VKSLVAHPGLSATNLQVSTSKDGGMGEAFTAFLMNNVGQSGEDGTVPLLTCCCSPDVKSGDFYGPNGMSGPCMLQPQEPEEAFADEASRKMLWEVSASVTGGKFPF